MQTEFQFKPFVAEIAEPEPLSNTERQLLRELAEPGLPLWKIMRQLHDYREGLKEAIADPEFDLEDPAVRRTFAKIQNGIASITDVFSRFEQALTDVQEPRHD